MNRILHWLTVKLSRSTSTGATEERSVSKEENPDEPVASTDDDTQPNLEIIKDPSQNSNKSESFDPYDSGSFKVLKK